MFIDVRPDLSIEIKHIEAIEAIDKLNSMVYTSSHSYKIPMPKDVLVSIISNKQKQSFDSVDNTENLLQQMYKGQSTPRP